MKGFGKREVKKIVERGYTRDQPRFQLLPGSGDFLKTKILLVEDEADMRDFVLGLLTKAGYEAAAVKTAEAALERLRGDLPHLLVTDLKLPGLSGYKLCEILKGEERTASLPVIMLTVLGHESEKVRGLNTGADDYITKPFSGKELLARADALLRRTRHGGAVTPVIAIDSLAVDLDKHEARADGRLLDLRPKEYNLLVLLMERAGKVMSYDALSGSLWKEGEHPTRETLKTHVKNLRRKLGRFSHFIKAVKGVGYKITPGK